LKNSTCRANIRSRLLLFVGGVASFARRPDFVERRLSFVFVLGLGGGVQKLMLGFASSAVAPMNRIATALTIHAIRFITRHPSVVKV
jgi:hypothetical protein